MAVSHVQRRYFKVLIVGYVIERPQGKDSVFEKLIIKRMKSDGTYMKETKVSVTNGKQECLKGMERDLVPLLGELSKWDTLVGTELNIPVRMLMLNTKKDPTGFVELALSDKKPVIIAGHEGPEPMWTDEEIEAIRPVGRDKVTSTMGQDAPPVINTGGDY